MPIQILPLTDLNDPRQKRYLQNLLKELGDMAFKLTFKAKDGTVGGGKRSYNFDAVWVAYVSNGTANTEDTVAHTLGRVPVGAFVGLPDKNAVIYDSGTTWTTSNIYLKASAATVTVNLLLF